MKIKGYYIRAAAVGLALFSSTPVLAQAVVNGSFQTPVLPSWSRYVYNPTPAFFGPSGIAAPGSPFFSAPLASAQAGFIQSFDGSVGSIGLGVVGLTVGSQYSFSFYLTQRPDYANNPLTVSFKGLGLGTYSAPNSSAFTLFTTPVFTATSTSGVVNFKGSPSTNGDNDVAIANVTVSAGKPGAVPEPATWSMMLLGFGAIGVAVRRRRNSGPALIA